MHGSQFFYGEQSATITIVVPAKPTIAALDSTKIAASVALQGLSTLTAAVVPPGMAVPSPFGVPNSLGLSFPSAFLPPISPIPVTEHSENNVVLPTKPVFTASVASTPASAVVSAPFSSTPSIPLSSATPSSWFSGGGQTSGLWGDHSLKAFQSNMWTGQIDEKTDVMHHDDTSAKANLPSFFATDSVVDFCLEGEDDIVDTLASSTAESLFGFDEFSGPAEDSWTIPAATATTTASFSTSSASPWSMSTNSVVSASQPKSLPTAVTTSAATASVVAPAVGVLSPSSPTKVTQQQQGGSGSGPQVQPLPLLALIALATSDTTWSADDFNEGIRHIFQRLNRHEAATCAMSLRFTSQQCRVLCCSSHFCTGMSS
jgi:hypothetical protein